MNLFRRCCCCVTRPHQEAEESCPPTSVQAQFASEIPKMLQHQNRVPQRILHSNASHLDSSCDDLSAKQSSDVVPSIPQIRCSEQGQQNAELQGSSPKTALHMLRTTQEPKHHDSEKNVDLQPNLQQGAPTSSNKLYSTRACKNDKPDSDISVPSTSEGSTALSSLSDEHKLDEVIVPEHVVLAEGNAASESNDREKHGNEEPVVASVQKDTSSCWQFMSSEKRSKAGASGCFDILHFQQTSEIRRRDPHHLSNPSSMVVTCNAELFRFSVQHAQKKCSNYADICSRLQHLSEAYVQDLMLARDRNSCATLHVPSYEGSDVDSWIVHAAVSLALFRVYPSTSKNVTLQCDGWQPCLQHAHDFRLLHMQDSAMKELSAQHPLSADQNGFRWARHNNDPQSRLLRLAATCISLNLFQDDGHVLPLVVGKSSLSSCTQIENMTKGTRFGYWNDPIHQGALGRHVPSHRPDLIHFESSCTVLEAAVRASRRTQHVVAVNAASAYRPGGGFLTGGRHALEEAFCMQTTLYCSLAQAEILAKTANNGLPLKDIFGRPIHIPDDGCLISPQVEVIRSGTDDGYKICNEFIVLGGVVSVAMPNRNPSVVDSPVERRSGESYHILLRRKFQAVVRSAINLGANVLVVPDCGCGVFKNDPVHVGHALGEVIRECDGCFDQVLIVGQLAFANAVKSSYAAGRGRK